MEEGTVCCLLHVQQPCCSNANYSNQAEQALATQLGSSSEINTNRTQIITGNINAAGGIHIGQHGCKFATDFLEM